MSIEAIASIGAQVATAIEPAATGSIANMSFDNVLGSLQTLNTQMLENQGNVRELALGQTDNLHQVLMNMEQTRLGFDLMMAVRNKFLDAYQELMRMQV